MYDSVTARFLQEDDPGYSDPNDPLSLNLYTYCHNEPIMYTDPTGHEYTQWDAAHLSDTDKKRILEETAIWYKYNELMLSSTKGTYDYASFAAKANEAHDISEAIRDAYRGGNDYGTAEGYTNTYYYSYPVYRDKKASIDMRDVMNIASYTGITFNGGQSIPTPTATSMSTPTSTPGSLEEKASRLWRQFNEEPSWNSFWTAEGASFEVDKQTWGKLFDVRLDSGWSGESWELKRDTAETIFWMALFHKAQSGTIIPQDRYIQAPYANNNAPTYVNELEGWSIVNKNATSKAPTNSPKLSASVAGDNMGFAGVGNRGAGKSPQLKIDSAQFGKKVGKHAQDYGLDPKSSQSRQWVNDHINNIHGSPDEVRQGTWRGLGDKLPDGNRADGNALFYRQGNDIVVTDMTGNFVTILKDGAIQNTRFQGATTIFTK